VLLILFDHDKAAFWLFIAAAVSDAVDGFIAKQFGMATTFGAYLDPIADKSLLVGVYIALAHEGGLPVWLVFLVGFRDLSIIGGVLLMLAVSDVRRNIEPLLISKLNTVAQLLLAAIALWMTAYEAEIGPTFTVLIYVVALTTVASGLAYLARLIRGGELENHP